jgi:hypothetical protein
VTVGTVGAATTVATCTAAPLDPPNDVTTAVRAPTLGDDENVTVRDVGVAAVTVPMPLLRTTVLADGVDASKPVPAIVNVAAFWARFAELKVTVGADGGVGVGPGGVGPGGVGPGGVGVGVGVTVGPASPLAAATAASWAALSVPASGTPLSSGEGTGASAPAGAGPAWTRSASRLRVLVVWASRRRPAPAATHPVSKLNAAKDSTGLNKGTASPPALPHA